MLNLVSIFDSLSSYIYNPSWIDISRIEDFTNVGSMCAEYMYETVLFGMNGGFKVYLSQLNANNSIALDGVLNAVLSFGSDSFSNVSALLINAESVLNLNQTLDLTLSPTLFVINNLELLSIVNSNNDSLFYTTSKVLLKTEFVNTFDSFSTGFVLYTSTLLILYLLLVLYYTSNNKLNSSEATTDNEYLMIWSLAESEKEIGSADDLIFLMIILSYIFGWFFGLYFYFILSKLPEFMTFMYSVPGIFYVAFSTPTYLMYDYGLFYGTYLRGVGGSSFFIYEFGYDLIMISVFYIRLALQGIRIVLMLIACASYYDYIMFYNFKGTMLLKPVDLNTDHSTLLSVACYWFLVKVPGTIMYVMYEVLHLWFILLSQTLSFFAMIFWLFLFLYSFFLTMSVENFFKDLRLRRSAHYNKLKGL